jgi:thioredoxin 1
MFNIFGGNFVMKACRIVVVLVPLLVQSVLAAERQATAPQIQAGTAVVTLKRCPVMRGDETLATLDAKTQIKVSQVQHEWLGVFVKRDGQEMGGWIAQADVKPVGPSDSSSEKTAEPSVVHADDASFEEQVLQAKTPVLVDFCATWCGPCQSLAPILENVARENPKTKIVKVDIDQSRGTASRFDVHSIPCLIVFREGKALGREVGLVGKERVKSLLGL